MTNENTAGMNEDEARYALAGDRFGGPVRIDGLARRFWYGLDAAVIADGDAASFHQQAKALEGVGEHRGRPFGKTYLYLRVLLRDPQQIAARACGDAVGIVLAGVVIGPRTGDGEWAIVCVAGPSGLRPCLRSRCGPGPTEIP